MLATDLELAKTAARAAGEVLVGYFKNTAALDVRSKRAGDFVSQADLASENLLRELLLGANSSDAWLGEETGSAGEGGRRWIVDPLDGTTNFLRGLPNWAVSIALEVDGALMLGVVYDPIKDELFSALSGNGAHLNSGTISVSGTEEFSSAVFGTGIPFGTLPYIPDHARQIAAIMPHCAGVRRFGAAALDLAYVACGRFDGYWERNLRLWDIAAGLVILREAGAKVTGWSDSETSEQAGDVICATPGLFDEFATLLRTA